MDKKMKHNNMITKNIDKEKAEFIYQASQEYLLHTIDTIKLLRAKATLILGFALSVIAFAIPLIFQEKNNYNDEFEIVLIIIIIGYTVISLCLVFFVIFPMSYAVTGNEPDNLIKQEILSNDMIQIKLLEIDDYQHRINLNIEIASRIQGFIEKSIYVVVGLPLILLVCSYFLNNLEGFSLFVINLGD